MNPAIMTWFSWPTYPGVLMLASSGPAALLMSYPSARPISVEVF
jgi:hypothetical protein